MTTTELPTLNQPAPEQIFTVEQAIAALKLDPNVEHREAAYAYGFTLGGIAGQLFDWMHKLPAELADVRTAAYETSLVPLRFDTALRAPARFPQWREAGSDRYSAEALVHIGVLSGFREATETAADAIDCPACGRRLFEVLDGVYRCPVDGVALCGDDAECARSYCAASDHDHSVEAEPSCIEAVQ